jgi:ferredoxin-NADP reductase
MHARFVRYDWENDAKTVATFYLQPDKPYYFTAGQYADITVPHDAADARGLTRTMSWTTSPSEKLLGFTTKFTDTDSTYKQALLSLSPGDTVTLTDSMGDMVLPLDSRQPLVFVAGGLGIASYVSMAKWLAEQQDARQVTLLYAVRNIGDIIFQETYDRYQHIGSLTRVLYTTDQKANAINWPGEIRNTRLTGADIMKYAGNDAMVYISGTETMVEQLQQELQTVHKLPQYRLAFDYYDGYTDL